MFKKTISLMVIASAMFATIFAAPVDSETAQKIAKNWYGNFSDNGVSAVEKTLELKYNGETTIFVTIMKNGGFVMVAADDASIPVLGYSLTSNFDEAGTNPHTNYWFTQYHKQITEIRELNLSNNETLSKWDDILESSFDIYKGGRDVEPLVQDTWNQSPVYNNYCPEDAGGRAVTGCVATAMAMIMHYHQHPTHGDGSHAYNWHNGTTWIQNSADFGSTVYNWEMMPTSISSGNSSEEIHEVATINYHAGVSVDMQYGSSGSGAYSEDVPVAMRTYFGYGYGANLKQRVSYSLTNWQDMIRADHDAGKPVYYAGRSTDGGHAFITDGYQTAGAMFHFNWGWGGSSNGYFAIDALNTGNGSYNIDQRIINNITPIEEDLIITENISDVLLSSSSMVINLNDHFESIGGNSISYSIESNSNSSSVSTSISGSNLTLTQEASGFATIRINANTSTEDFFDIFDVRVVDEGPSAGYGNTYDFAATSYINAGSNSSQNDMELLTVSAWVKLNELGSSHGIISKNTSTSNGWYFNINSVNKIKFYIKGADGDTRKLYSSSALPENEWIHLTGTYDGQVQKIYFNGILDREEDHGDYEAISTIDEQSLFIGRSVSYYTNASVDDVRLWDRGLTASEVIESMGNELVGTETDLVGYWKIDENIGGVISDLTGNNDGTMAGLNNENWETSTAPARYMTVGGDLTGILPGKKDGSVTYELVSNPSSLATITNAATGEFTFTQSSGSVEEFTYKVVEDGNNSAIITAIVTDLDLSISGDEFLANSVVLAQNYPNPFNPITKINYELRITNYESAAIVVYNSKGEQVWQKSLALGTSSINFDGSRFNSGVYYYSLLLDGKNIQTKSMVLIK